MLLRNIETGATLAEQIFDFGTTLRCGDYRYLYHKRVGDISGRDNSKEVPIARVLSKRPKIIFADEPTGNLDTVTAQLVIDV